jgi:glucokinase
LDAAQGPEGVGRAAGAAPEAAVQAGSATAVQTGSATAVQTGSATAVQAGSATVVHAGPGAVGLDVEPYREDRAVTARVLAADARAGDPVAVRAMRRAGRALGLAIAAATHLCDLDLVTIGGGLSQAGEPLFGPLDEALREHARMTFARRVEVVPAALGQEAGLIGAAALLLAEDAYWR